MAGPEPHELDLRELEFDADSGIAVAQWIDRVRALLRRHAQLSIRGCPQMLAHTLYKTGMLRDGRITLVEPREEEPYG